MNIALWIVQALLAALFLFAGGVKLITPIEEMTKQIAMPGWFLRFIGVAEVLGALGLILPWLLRIKPVLTPLAASVGLSTSACRTTRASVPVTAFAHLCKSSDRDGHDGHYTCIPHFLYRPTVCLDVISLVASSCGDTRGESEPRGAQSFAVHVASQRRLAERPQHRRPPRAQPSELMR